MAQRSLFPEGMPLWGLLASLLASTLSATAAFSAEPPIPIVLGPRIGPIILGFTQSQVEERLGKPERVVSTGEVLDPEIRYPGLTMWMRDQEGVMQIRSTSPKYCLASDICPGDSAAGVEAKLGPKSIGAGVNIYHAIFRIDELCWAGVTVEKDFVSDVEVKCVARKN